LGCDPAREREESSGVEGSPVSMVITIIAMKIEYFHASKYGNGARGA
jgi:hypothetical protein